MYQDPPAPLVPEAEQSKKQERPAKNYFVGGALCQDPPALPAPEAEQSTPGMKKERPNLIVVS